MHNLSNYDAHLFVRELSKCPGKLNVIPETAEKYISISKSLKVGEYLIIIIIILFEYHYKKVQSSTKCTRIKYTPAMVNSDIKARE